MDILIKLNIMFSCTFNSLQLIYYSKILRRIAISLNISFNSDMSEYSGAPAAKKRKINKMDTILIESDEEDDTLNDLLFQSIKDGDSHGVLEQVQQGADVNKHILNGSNTPLIFAAENGHHEIVKILLDNGAEVDTRARHNRTALHEAARCGHLDVVKELLNHMDNIDDISDQDCTALHYAAANGHTDVVRILVEHGSEINAANIDGNTALHLAVISGHDEITEILIENGADLKAKNGLFETPLQLARKHMKPNTYNVMVKKHLECYWKWFLMSGKAKCPNLNI